MQYMGKNNAVDIVYNLLVQEKYLKSYVNDCFKINGKQMIKIPKNGEYVTFKNYKRKIKASFMIYADFKSILVPEGNGKQNPNKSFKSKYPEHVACSYGYELVC